MISKAEAIQKYRFTEVEQRLASAVNTQIIATYGILTGPIKVELGAVTRAQALVVRDYYRALGWSVSVHGAESNVLPKSYHMRLS